MKLIVLYGPPASGKLTVAKALSKITGYKIFHNHLLIDLLEKVLPWGSSDFKNYMDKYFFELLEVAMKHNVEGLIVTMVYYKDFDKPYLKTLVKTVEKQGGEVCFVQLKCSTKELLRRVTNASRKKFKKISTVQILKQSLKKHDIVSSVDYANNLVIDSEKNTPVSAARKIKEKLL